MALSDDYPLAGYKTRQAGTLRVAMLRAGIPSTVEGQPGVPPIVVEFEVPGGVEYAKAEARAAKAIHNAREHGADMERYGWDDVKMAPDEFGALTRLVTAAESAILLWRDWNFAERVGGEMVDGVMVGGTLVKVDIKQPANIVRLLEDPDIRGAWLAHLSKASPLEPDEGNVSAASPSGTTEEAAKPVEDAPRPEPLAQRDGPDATASIAPST